MSYDSVLGHTLAQFGGSLVFIGHARHSPADVYVVGVQELVDLGPMSMLLNTAGHEERQMLLEERVEAVLASSGRNFLKAPNDVGMRFQYVFMPFRGFSRVLMVVSWHGFVAFICLFIFLLLIIYLTLISLNKGCFDHGGCLRGDERDVY